MSTRLGNNLHNKRVIVVCGSGGVGKTSVSAAIALQAAREGVKSLALTIDPARRLADALGLQEIGNEATPIDPKLLEKNGIETKAQMSAMMLDTKTAWDSLIKRFAPTPATAKKIYNNRLYKNLSARFSGAQDYAAAETLYDFVTRDQFDLVVLDTPPSIHALDFLDAPTRLVELLNDRLLSLFLKPTTMGLNIFSRGGKAFLGFIERVTSVELIREISEFFNSLSDLIGTFKARSEDMISLFKDDRTVFVVVTGPDRLAVEEGVNFRHKLDELGMPFGGYIVNRVAYHRLSDEQVRRDYGKMTSQLASKAREVSGEACPGPADKLLHNFTDWINLAEAQEKNIHSLAKAAPDGPIYRLPQLVEEISDISGVGRLARELFEKQ